MHMKPHMIFIDFYGFHLGKYTIVPWILYGLYIANLPTQMESNFQPILAESKKKIPWMFILWFPLKYYRVIFVNDPWDSYGFSWIRKWPPYQESLCTLECASARVQPAVEPWSRSCMADFLTWEWTNKPFEDVSPIISYSKWKLMEIVYCHLIFFGGVNVLKRSWLRRRLCDRPRARDYWWVGPPLERLWHRCLQCPVITTLKKHHETILYHRFLCMKCMDMFFKSSFLLLSTKIDCLIKNMSKTCRWGVLHQDLSKPFDLGRSEVQLVERFLLLKVEISLKAETSTGNCARFHGVKYDKWPCYCSILLFSAHMQVIFTVFLLPYLRRVQKNKLAWLLSRLFFPIGILTLTSIAKVRELCIHSMKLKGKDPTIMPFQEVTNNRL